MTPANPANSSAVFRRQLGPGLEIKLYEPADAEAVFAAVEQDRAYLGEWLPWVERTRSAADVLQFISTVVTPQWRDNTSPNCGIWMNGNLAGSVGCHPIDRQNHSCSLGYWIASRHQGHGIVTRAVVAMLDYLLGELKLHRVVIQCGTGNHRSCTIPKRLGFTREGVAREAECVGGRWIDLIVWSILHSEWNCST